MTISSRVQPGTPAGGQFEGHSRTDGAVSLDASVVPTSTQFYDRAFGSARPNLRDPTGITETRAALRNSRGENDGAIRLVRLTWASVPPASNAGDLEVVGPKDGRALSIHLHSGLPHLLIKSGNVVVFADSGAGNSITVEDGASAIVVAGNGRRKISTTTKDGATTEMYAEPDTFGYQSVESGGVFTAHGDSSGIQIGRHDS